MNRDTLLKKVIAKVVGELKDPLLKLVLDSLKKKAYRAEVGPVGGFYPTENIIISSEKLSPRIENQGGVLNITHWTTGGLVKITKDKISFIKNIDEYIESKKTLKFLIH